MYPRVQKTVRMVSRDQQATQVREHAEISANILKVLIMVTAVAKRNSRRGGKIEGVCDRSQIFSENGYRLFKIKNRIPPLIAFHKAPASAQSY
jgi:hypothetical protein